MGGKLSFAICMLDKNDNGCLVNVMHSNNGCFAYIKEIINGESFIELGDEEANALKQVPACRFIASKTDRSKYLIGELNGRPARKVYQDILNIGDKEMATQTFKNPLGKMNGQDICIISIKEVVGDKLECYRQVNDSDVLTLLELQDISHVVENTINQIKKDFTHISGVFSINCVFRYLLFSQEHYFETYLKSMSVLGDHAGLIGYGEHYNQQFVNQTMTCVVFE